MAYDAREVKAPRVAGPMLRAAVAAIETPLTGPAVAHQLLRNIGVIDLRRVAAGEPLPIKPPEPRPTSAPEAVLPDVGALLRQVAEAETDEPPAHLERAEDLVAAYLERRVTPTQVAARVIDNTRASDRLDPPMRLFIAQDADDLMDQAEASARRYREGEPLGPLDGVPVAVKDELDQAPYPTTVGTTFLGRERAAEDATAVARLRRAGALLIGKANMQELGLGVMGFNPHYGTARNPYDPARSAGGSSTGPAAAVAAGLCPIAVGADGGGSIRIPASFCGQLGLKPTFGRVSEHGAAPLCWSLAHVGPIAGTSKDLALAYAAMAGLDEADPNTFVGPRPELDGLFDEDLSGLRLGVYRPWFEHADEEVVGRCREALNALEAAGAEVREVEIPDLDLVRLVHLVTIVSEIAASRLLDDHHRSELALESRLNLALAHNLRAHDYIHAQRLRARICRHLEGILSGEVDVIVTPSTACTAPPLLDDALPQGQSDLELTVRIMRFAQVANLTGLPALTCPAGHDAGGLPVGVQLLGRPWEEATLLRLAAVIERSVERRPPRVRYRLLGARG